MNKLNGCHIVSHSISHSIFYLSFAVSLSMPTSCPFYTRLPAACTLYNSKDIIVALLYTFHSIITIIAIEPSDAYT